MKSVPFRTVSRTAALLLLLVGSGTCKAGVEVTKFDMTSIFNRDGIWSVAVGDQPNDGFDEAGECLPERGYFPGEEGLPPDGKVGDFQLGNYDSLNMLSIVQGAGVVAFDLSARGQAGEFERLRFLTATGDGYTGTDTDKLVVRLVYADRAIVVWGEDAEFSLQMIEDGDWSTHSGQDVHSLVCSDPGSQLFEDVGNWDFHLREGSIAIDKGTADGAPSDDYDGVSRPQGAGFDIGAYERN